MRRFAFKLEKVLELRRHAEREWELRLAEVTGRVVASENEMRHWAGQRHDASMLRIGAGVVDMDLLRSRDGYLDLVDSHVAQLQNRIAALEVERGKVREDYLVVSRKRKALTKLKERFAAEYYSAAVKEQNREIDEIGGTQAVQRIKDEEESGERADV